MEGPSDKPLRPRSIWPRLVLCIVILPIVYLFSYAPYLRFLRDPDDYVSRTSEFYRGAEWLFSKCDNFPLFRGWAGWFGVEPVMNWQVLVYEYHASQSPEPEE